MAKTLKQYLCGGGFFLLMWALPASARDMGGISGGGGGTTNPRPAEMMQIVEAAYESRLLLTAWLNNEESTYLSFDPAEEVDEDHEQKIFEKKLFESSPNVFDLMKKLKIDFMDTAPCLDANGREVDGSANPAIDPYRICISGYRLAQKLTRYNYEYETAALVLHEISHLLGVTETEALEIQTQALEGVMHETHSHYQRHLLSGIMNASSEAYNVFDSLSEIPPEDLSCAFAEAALGSVSVLGRMIHTGSLSAMRQSESVGMVSAAVDEAQSLRLWSCEPKRDSSFAVAQQIKSIQQKLVQVNEPVRHLHDTSFDMERK